MGDHGEAEVIDLCFMLVDLGSGQYRKLASEMVDSAWRAGLEFRSVQFSDEATEAGTGGGVRRLSDVHEGNLMLKRAEMLKDYARIASGHTIMCDCDVVWQRDPTPLFDGSFDIGLCWRTGQPSMPYMGGMVLVRHGSEAAIEFLNEWWFTIVTMPKTLHRWWGDQLALASMLGRQAPGSVVSVNGCRVKIFDSGDLMFQVADADQKAPQSAYARHYKGKAKSAMLEKGAA